ncbi:MAG: ATP-binding cassette domain-containing protein [Firmicutes bacterium]|nr:ATP-binding cassette domain-containing protein [Bacillota bacterium]
MQEPVVQLKDVTFTYAGSPEPALRGLNLNVQPGEFVTVTGPSGCGKSTLSFCLTGFIPHSFEGVMAGSVAIGGRDTGEITPGELAGIAGLVQQDPEAQLCTLHVAEEIAFGPENLGLPPAEIARRLDWALEAAGITPLKRRSLHTLSGGEKQRVAIASVLAMKPQLLILDEPTANLDPRGCREVLAVVERLRREQNVAIIVFEHRLQQLLPLSDRLIIMEAGEIVARGGAAEAAGLWRSYSRAGRRKDAFSGMLPRDPAAAERGTGPSCTSGQRESGERRGGLADQGALQQERRKTPPHLSVEELTVCYGRQPVLKDISFALHHGETAALMGDNGCGKSTLLLALLGILEPHRGRVCLGGKDLAESGVPRRAREMGLIFQNPNQQLFEKTVLKEAGLPSQFLAGDGRESLDRVEQLLHYFELERYRDKLPFTLSLGEKKRLTLVSVLAYEPSILLLDEPLVGQDQDRLDLLIEALGEHSRKGGGTLMVCHEPAVVAACCTRVLFLEEGELIVDAPTAAAFSELDRLEKCDYLPADFAIFR